MAVVFFFQAEDGIRDLVRSRGLGDVYKRQILVVSNVLNPAGTRRLAIAFTASGASGNPSVLTSVSYTHLTLPTSDLV